MDARTFDRFVVAAATRPSRRTALRLLAGGLLGSLLATRGAAAAQRPDRDGDGLFDDDEAFVYGTNPDVYDTDGDGFGDGEEVYFGTDPLANGTLGGAVQGICADGFYDCAGVCTPLLRDTHNCGACGFRCASGATCQNGFCVGVQPVCSGLFGPCGESLAFNVCCDGFVCGADNVCLFPSVGA